MTKWLLFYSNYCRIPDDAIKVKAKRQMQYLKYFLQKLKIQYFLDVENKQIFFNSNAKFI